MSNFQRILVPVDGSATSLRGVEAAAHLGRFSNGRLMVLHVMDELSFALGAAASAARRSHWNAELQERSKAIVDEAAKLARDLGLDVDTMVADGSARPLRDVVAEQAAHWQADLIVVGTHGRRGVQRLMLGSGAEQILRSAVVPVLVVRAPEQHVAGEKIDLHVPEGVLALE